MPVLAIGAAQHVLLALRQDHVTSDARRRRRPNMAAGVAIGGVVVMTQLLPATVVVAPETPTGFILQQEVSDAAVPQVRRVMHVREQLGELLF